MYLKNAPIKEAQINIKFNKNVDLALINQSSSGLSTLKNKQPFYNITQTVGIGPQGSRPSITQQHIGFRIQSDDQKKGMIFNVDGIAFSVVEDYEGWDKFISEFTKVIAELKGSGLTFLIKQVGLRFINRLSFEVGEDISKYLKILPSLPEKDFSSTADNLLLRYNVTEKRGARASVNFIYEGIDPKTQKLQFNFDISANCAKTIPISDDKIIDDLVYLRNYKNDIFFNSITDDLIKKYNA